VSCPLCGLSDTPHLFSAWDRNRRVSGESFNYHRCTRCGTIFLADPPADLGRYYSEAYYDFPDADALDAAAPQETYKLDLIRPVAPTGRLVEIGPGVGAFARLARKRGYDVTTIEMDPRVCAHLRSVAGVKAIESAAPEEALQSMPSSQAIALWHVLEHLPRPWASLESAAENLAPGGVLVIATPNPESLQLRLLRARWPHLDAPRHLYLLPAHLLLERAAKLGLERVSLTTRDSGGRAWNRFGWGHAVRPPNRGLLDRVAARAAGAALATAAAPLERRGLNGATYTAVFRKPADSSASRMFE
jgi:2-polyprenyl-3-methyl-5-hydroxy-6-metoxy-1,4-benzoquinol methylase